VTVLELEDRVGILVVEILLAELLGRLWHRAARRWWGLRRESTAERAHAEVPTRATGRLT
jgi:hypothetical protein